MKKALFEIFIGEIGEITFYERDMKNFTVEDIRQVIAILEEIKSDLIDEVKKNRKVVKKEEKCEIQN